MIRAAAPRRAPLPIICARDRARHPRHTQRRHRRGRGADPHGPRRDARRGGVRRRRARPATAPRPSSSPSSTGPTWSSSTSRCRCSTGSRPPSGSPRQRIAPVVILTAFSQRDLVERARDAGAMAYLVKPFSKGDLVPGDRDGRQPVRRGAQLEQEVADLQDRLETRKAGRPGQEHPPAAARSSPSPRRSAGSRRPPWTCGSRCVRWPRAWSPTGRASPAEPLRARAAAPRTSRGCHDSVNPGDDAAGRRRDVARPTSWTPRLPGSARRVRGGRTS